MKVKIVVERTEDIVTLSKIDIFPYGIEVEEGGYYDVLEEEPESYDSFLAVLDTEGEIEQIFDTKAEVLNSWLDVHNQELIKKLF